MKKNVFFLFLLTGFVLASCGAMKRAALKYWTKKQVKEFVANCVTKAAPIVGEEKAAKYCDCAVDIVAEKYQDYSHIKTVPIREIIRLAKDCSGG